MSFSTDPAFLSPKMTKQTDLITDQYTIPMYAVLELIKILLRDVAQKSH